MATRNMTDMAIPARKTTATSQGQYRISSHPRSHTLVTFRDQFDLPLFQIDSKTNNIPGFVRHTVHIAISKTTGNLAIREQIGGLESNAVSIVGTLDIDRESFSLVRVGNEHLSPTGGEAFCIELILQFHTLRKGSVDIQIPRIRPFSQKLDFQSNIQSVPSVRRIKIHFALPWGNSDLVTEQVKLMLRPRAPGPVPPPAYRRNPSNPPSGDLSTANASLSPRTAAHSVKSRYSVESTRSENATSYGSEEDTRVRELEERVRKQAEENEKNNKRMQDLEDLIRGKVQIRSKENVDDGDVVVAEAIQRASTPQQTQDPLRAAITNRDIAPEIYSQEMADYKARIKELEETVAERDERNQELETKLRKQAELIATLEEDYRLRDGPDIAALGAELAFSRGVDKGDRAGVEARLPSARLSEEVVGRLVNNTVFSSSFLVMSEERRAHREEGEVFESDEESGDAHDNKRIKIEGGGEIVTSFGVYE